MANFVTKKGNVPFGFILPPAGLINYKDYHLKDACRRDLPASARDEQFVHFHFMGFTSNHFIAGCSLSKSSLQTAVFFYLFDRQKNEVVLKKGCRIEDGNADLTLNPDAGSSRLKSKGMEVTFMISPHKQSRELIIFLDGQEVLNLLIEGKEIDTLRLCTPTGPSGWTYVQKVAGAKASGHLNWRGAIFELEADEATAHYDFTAGFLRRETFWNWACVTGISASGDLIGLNLSNAVNETGASENALWLNGKMSAITSVFFDYNPENLNSPWGIHDQNKLIDLTFHPDGAYTAFHPDSPTPVDFSQLFGTFSGKVTDQKGKSVYIDYLPGFTERQYSVWW